MFNEGGAPSSWGGGSIQGRWERPPLGQEWRVPTLPACGSLSAARPRPHCFASAARVRLSQGGSRGVPAPHRPAGAAHSPSRTWNWSAASQKPGGRGRGQGWQGRARGPGQTTGRHSPYLGKNRMWSSVRLAPWTRCSKTLRADSLTGSERAACRTHGAPGHPRVGWAVCLGLQSDPWPPALLVPSPSPHLGPSTRAGARGTGLRPSGVARLAWTAPCAFTVQLHRQLPGPLQVQDGKAPVVRLPNDHVHRASGASGWAEPGQPRTPYPSPAPLPGALASPWSRKRPGSPVSLKSCRTCQQIPSLGVEAEEGTEGLGTPNRAGPLRILVQATAGVREGQGWGRGSVPELTAFGRC